MSRQLNDTLPSIPQNLESKVVNKGVVREKENHRRRRIEKNYNISKGVRQLPELVPGTRVFIKDNRRFGTVVQKADQPRSYIIQTDTNQLRRNRHTIFPITPNGKDDTDTLQEEQPQRGSLTPTRQEETPTEGREIVSGEYRTRAGRISKPPQRLNL